MPKQKLPFLFLFFSLISLSSAQDYKAKVQLSIWTDTLQYPELTPIVNLYINYIESSPDSIYNNPFWNSAEKKKYEDFDISRNSVFQGGQGAWTAKSFYNFFTAHILSIEKRDSVYKIRVMYYRTEKDKYAEDAKRFNPAQIQRYYAIKENGEWKLANAFTFDLADWHSVETKYINYHFPNSSLYSEGLAEKANRFCDSIICRFDFPPLEEKIEYYICTGEFEVGEVLGYDYYIYGWALGKTIQNKIISGNGTVYYPHEFVHFIDDDPEARGHNVSEGFATWLGGSVGKSYPEMAKIFADEYFGNDTANFAFAWTWENKLNKYCLGALIIDLVFDAKGDQGVLDFMKMPSKTAEETQNSIQELCRWNSKKFNRKWTQKVGEFASKHK